MIEESMAGAPHS